jgi:hypothetical protein
MASGQEPVLSGIFTCDQLKPSVHYMEPEEVSIDPPTPGMRAGPLPSGADPESAPNVFMVTGVDKDLAVKQDPQADWRTPYLDCLFREVLPTDKNRGLTPLMPR